MNPDIRTRIGLLLVNPNAIRIDVLESECGADQQRKEVRRRYRYVGKTCFLTQIRVGVALE